MFKTIPNFKNAEWTEKLCTIKNIKWEFAKETDERVVREALRIDDSDTGTIVCVSHKNSDEEGYEIQIDEDEIRIIGYSSRGAFYALKTLKMLLKKSDCLNCGVIKDYPDMKYRGFYQDTTRGRVPTLETLKKLVDDMADYKMNSLQLYVEHSYEFEEYKHCRELGYLTKAEIQELDKYCRDRFIELIPSLATFGHLYHLLECDKYKHLCELVDYTPKMHYWGERMLHHTINPLKEESFQLITSLIDQHMEAFSSNYFNICCDETFDLGKDVNKNKNKADLYINFVKKLVKYLEDKGKTVMMWGDIVLQYPDRIDELSDNVIFLNWYYEKTPDEKKFEALKDKQHIVCPATSSWYSFFEQPNIEEDNIFKLSEYAHKYNAIGMLNTNWGDYGNPASINMAMYGMILGAVKSWDKSMKMTDEFRETVSLQYYGNTQAAKLLYELSEASINCYWGQYLFWQEYEIHSKEKYQSMVNSCEEIAEKFEKAEFYDDFVKSEFINSAKGQALLNYWTAKKFGISVECNIYFEQWLNDYINNWMKTTKKSELDEMIKVLKKANQ